MWILPKSLTCRFAPGTEALTSDCGDASRACGQSLMLRSKPSRASSFLRGWKAGNLMRLRSGLISSPSRGESFADWWTSSLADTRASHSQLLASDSEAKTRDTCGRLSQAAFDFFNLESASLKTSRATLPKGCITSCLTWEDWVIEQRGEFSARLNAARLISGSGSLSWPTATARDFRDTGDLSSSDYRADGKLRKDVLPRAVDLDRRGHYGSTKIHQWPTPQTSDQNQAASPDRVGHRLQLRDVETGFGRPAPASSNTDGSRQESWPTPSAMDGQRPSETPQQWETRNAAKKAANPNLGQLHRPLTVAVQWGTPRASIKGGHYEFDRGRHNIEEQAGASTLGGGKLNPRWVETLMGLPVGWTMPSCASPATIAPTSSDCSATESCQQQPSSPSAS